MGTMSTRKPGGVPSMGWHRVGHDGSDLAAAAYLLVEIAYLFSAPGAESTELYQL